MKGEHAAQIVVAGIESVGPGRQREHLRHSLTSDCQRILFGVEHRRARAIEHIDCLRVNVIDEDLHLIAFACNRQCTGMAGQLALLHARGELLVRFARGPELLHALVAIVQHVNTAIAVSGNGQGVWNWPGELPGVGLAAGSSWPQRSRSTKVWKSKKSIRWLPLSTTSSRPGFSTTSKPRGAFNGPSPAEAIRHRSSACSGEHPPTAKILFCSGTL